MAARGPVAGQSCQARGLSMEAHDSAQSAGVTAQRRQQQLGMERGARLTNATSTHASRRKWNLVRHTIIQECCVHLVLEFQNAKAMYFTF